MCFYITLKFLKCLSGKVVTTLLTFKIAATAFSSIVSRIYLGDNEPICNQQCKIPTLHIYIAHIQLKV